MRHRQSQQRQVARRVGDASSILCAPGRARLKPTHDETYEVQFIYFEVQLLVPYLVPKYMVPGT